MNKAFWNSMSSQDTRKVESCLKVEPYYKTAAYQSTPQKLKMQVASSRQAEGNLDNLVTLIDQIGPGSYTKSNMYDTEIDKSNYGIHNANSRSRAKELDDSI